MLEQLGAPPEGWRPTHDIGNYCYPATYTTFALAWNGGQ
jgi:hypothetical protein